jgi:hypothetical protein
MRDFDRILEELLACEREFYPDRDRIVQLTRMLRDEVKQQWNEAYDNGWTDGWVWCEDQSE